MAAIKQKEIHLDQFKNCSKVYALMFLEGVYVKDGIIVVGVNKISDVFTEDNGFDEDDVKSIANLKVGETTMTETITGYPTVTRLK